MNKRGDHALITIYTILKFSTLVKHLYDDILRFFLCTKVYNLQYAKCRMPHAGFYLTTRGIFKIKMREEIVYIYRILYIFI